jgi:hypothetical protein
MDSFMYVVIPQRFVWRAETSDAFEAALQGVAPSDQQAIGQSVGVFYGYNHSYVGGAEYPGYAVPADPLVNEGIKQDGRQLYNCSDDPGGIVGQVRRGS